MNPQEISNLKKAGKIAAEAAKYAKSIIKPKIPLLEIIEKIEAKIIELGGKPAFPVNLSINDIAAHYTPSHDDKTLASGLLKVDIGVHVDGYIADTAFSLNLESDGEQKQINDKLIKASQKALENAIKIIKGKKDPKLWEIGKQIQDAIEKTDADFSPIRNLCGHELGEYLLHAGLTIPNYDNGNDTVLPEGSYAIEPFATTGQGVVYDGKPSGIYKFEERKAIRDSLAREIMNFIEKEYKTLPFCSRWIVKRFSSRALISLHLLEQAGILHHFRTLVEKSHKPVSQAEHTIILDANKNKVEVTTE